MNQTPPGPDATRPRYGQQQPAPAARPPQPPGPWRALRNVALAALGVAALVAAVAGAGALARRPGDPQAVTYVVTGSPATVTYGPAGSQLSGAVPMRVTAPLGDPAYYAVNAQLQGSGSVTCEILVDGRVIDEQQAAGGYGIALCEIGQDPASGQWQSEN